MSIYAHIKELRTRLFVLVVIFITASVVAYIFREGIAHVLMAPLGDQKLYNLTPGGQFSFILKIIMWAGFAATIPFLVASLYSFISPALPKRAQRHGPKILFFSMILLCAGAVFGYIYAIPGAIRFLLSFADGLVTPMITGESYLGFVLAYTVGLGLLFQIPLLMIIINWVTPLKPKMLLNMERYVIVFAFIAAAIITPTPDPANQAIIAAPVIAMYQVGFVAVLVSHSNTRRRLRRDSVQAKQEVTGSEPILLTSPLSTTDTSLEGSATTPIVKTPASRVKKAGMDVVRPVVSLQSRTPRNPGKLSVAARAQSPSSQASSQVRYLDGVSVSYSR